jgi:hypothetical protein
VNLILLYIDSKAVIPAPYQVRDKLQRESPSPTPPPAGERDRVRGGFRVKPGMTSKEHRPQGGALKTNSKSETEIPKS